MKPETGNLKAGQGRLDAGGTGSETEFRSTEKGMIMGNKFPEVGSLWRDGRTGTAYTIRSVDKRGVFLKAVVLAAFCRLPLEKFRTRFVRVEHEDAKQGRKGKKL